MCSHCRSHNCCDKQVWKFIVTSSVLQGWWRQKTWYKLLQTRIKQDVWNKLPGAFSHQLKLTICNVRTLPDLLQQLVASLLASSIVTRWRQVLPDLSTTGNKMCEVLHLCQKQDVKFSGYRMVKVTCPSSRYVCSLQRAYLVERGSVFLTFMWRRIFEWGATLNRHTVIWASWMFSVCVSLVLESKYEQFRIISSR